jgi:hypothetical protein
MLLASLLLLATSMPAQGGLWEDISNFFSSSDSGSSEVATPVPQAVQTGLKLLPLLSQILGVTSGQAEGGMGAILQASRELLSGTEYGVLVDAIPNVNSLLKAAPAISENSGGDGGILGSALKMASEYSDTAKTGSQLVSQFQALGMSADMIPKFANVTSDYLKNTEHNEAANVLTAGLASFL